MYLLPREIFLFWQAWYLQKGLGQILTLVIHFLALILLQESHI